MFKKALSVAASLALAEQALAFNAHRHHHDDKRALQVDVVTHYVTVTEYEGEGAPAATPTPVAEPVAEAQYTPSTTSTSVVVVPTPTPVAPVPTTTLVTSVASKSQAPVQEAAMAIAAVSSSSSSQAAVSTSAVKASSTTGGKRGLAYNDASLVNAFFNDGNTCEKCSWAYNWDSKSNSLSASVEFVPMLWSPATMYTDPWLNNTNEAFDNGATHVLGFNECDMVKQCNTDAETASVEYRRWITPLKESRKARLGTEARLGSPAISNSNLAKQGIEWLTTFMENCGDCKIDFCVTHWYATADASQTLYDHIEAVSKACGGLPVWLTEFAPSGTDDQINSFIQTDIPKLDAMDILERYSYFMVKEGSLTSGNALSTFGKSYASA